MVQHNGFRAWVQVDGQALNEFAADSPSEQQEGPVVRWIPSEEGQNFSVHWQDLQPERDESTCGYVHLDGTYVSGMIRRAHAPNVTLSAKGKLVDAVTERPFTFSALDLTDEDIYLEGSTVNALQNLGAIEIRIWKVGVSDPIPWEPGTGDLPGEKKIHEKSKKIGGHCVKLGDAKEISKPVIRNCTKIGSAPLVTFRFLYRPLGLLQANGIAPPPSPSPAASAKRARSASPDVNIKSEDEEDEEEEEREAALRQQLAAAQGLLANIQAQLDVKRKKPKRAKVKAEPITHRGVFRSREVVDLTLE